jgi:arylsulfatase A-like enzyme
VARNVLFITVDQWRGDSLSALGHPVLETPSLDALAADGVLFANHWANASPCGPSRACLYTGTYLHHNRSVQNGTPLDGRFTNVALLAREAGYRPVLFGYTDTSPDPRALPGGDPRLYSYEGILPGFDAVISDRWEEGSPEWGKWLAAQGVDVPANPHELYGPVPDFPGADDHGETWAPARFTAEHSETTFLMQHLTEWLERHGGDDGPGFFVHASFIRPHPPFRNPKGYHDLYDADAIAPFVAAPTREQEAGIHPLNAVVVAMSGLGAPDDERDRRQLRATYHGAQREVDDHLGRLFAHLQRLRVWHETMVVVTSDHGEMGCDHWLTQKLGYWDESYHVPCIVRDPRPAADFGRGTRVHSFTESVDVLPTLCDFLGVDVPPQVDGWPLTPFLNGEGEPEHWREEAHFAWDFAQRGPVRSGPLAELPSTHCSLLVGRGRHEKYVEFSGDDEFMPPLLFDLDEDPSQLHDLCAGRAGRRHADRAWEAARRMLKWRMRNDERDMSRLFLDPREGVVTTTDDWR